MVGHNRGMTSILSASDAKRDAALVAAVDEARDAAVVEAGGDAVGDHIAVVMEADRLATHTFACLNPAYVGWQWAVTLARAPRAKVITVSEVVLLPGPDALVAPEWVPWSARVQPGDLSAGDVLPTAADDPRLVAGLTDQDALEGVSSPSPLQPGQWEIGLGRLRVLSPIGRDDAADRWVEGDFGPTSAMAKQAALECCTCGFLLPMSGPMGQQFAVCANEMSPADGHVVALTFGCGAHSEAMVAPQIDPEPGSSETARDGEAVEAVAPDIEVDEIEVVARGGEDDENDEVEVDAPHAAAGDELAADTADGVDVESD